MGQWLGLRAYTAKGPGLILGWGTKIPQTVWLCQERKKKNEKRDITADPAISKRIIRKC